MVNRPILKLVHISEIKEMKKPILFLAVNDLDDPSPIRDGFYTMSDDESEAGYSIDLLRARHNLTLVDCLIKIVQATDDGHIDRRYLVISPVELWTQNGAEPYDQNEVGNSTMMVGWFSTSTWEYTPNLILTDDGADLEIKNNGHKFVTLYRRYLEAGHELRPGEVLH